MVAKPGGWIQAGQGRAQDLRGNSALPTFNHENRRPIELSRWRCGLPLDRAVQGKQSQLLGYRPEDFQDALEIRAAVIK